MTAPSPSPPPPVRWGSPPVHLISHFVRSRSFTGMVTRQKGLPDLPDGVILSAGLTCKRFRWAYQPSWGRIGVTSNSHHIPTIIILKVTIARKSLTAMKGWSKSSKQIEAKEYDRQTWFLLATFLFSPSGINIVQKKKRKQQLNKSQMGI